MNTAFLIIESFETESHKQHYIDFVRETLKRLEISRYWKIKFEQNLQKQYGFLTPKQENAAQNAKEKGHEENKQHSSSNEPGKNEPVSNGQALGENHKNEAHENEPGNNDLSEPINLAHKLEERKQAIVST